MSARYPVITICGSMRYYHQMLTHALNLTRDGYIVLMPYDTKYQDGTASDTTKHMLDDMHTHKIDMADRVHVIGEHIGESTRREIQYAMRKGVPIRHYDGDLTDVTDGYPAEETSGQALPGMRDGCDMTRCRYPIGSHSPTCEIRR